MRKLIISLAAILSFAFVNGQTIAPPIDFELTPSTVYNFANFDGVSSTVIANPQSNGINTSSNVGQMVKNAGQVWGGSLIQMTNPLDFSENVALNGVTVYPNPSNGQITLDFNHENERVNIRVLDISGRLVYKAVYTGLKNKLQLDLGIEESGVYFMNLQSGTEKTVQRLIIQK